ncbi:MAG TPA: penicillin-binding transpeptidase domain-containing protein, partial [Solirubrobacteraceae bacterium]|nr:penicillin-binding transpeptidase domain-containing protein [Solirubrobacteraceae bacterium]
MNRPIVRLYGLVLVLFALLVAFTSRWTIFEAASLRQSPLNRRALLQQERVQRGGILAAGGTVLARSVRGREGTFQRTYPTGSLFAQTVGYSYTDLGQSGLERYRNPALDGETTATNLQAILDQLQGKRRQGDEVLTTLNPAAQRTAAAALGEHRGAVVALDPRTGAVDAMASTPSYDPNLLRSSSAYQRLEQDPSSPLVNRALQYGYPPGSTFKVVTATAAIDTGQYTPQSLVSGRDGIIVSGLPLSNDEHESFGQITL